MSVQGLWGLRVVSVWVASVNALFTAHCSCSRLQLEFAPRLPVWLRVLHVELTLHCIAVGASGIPRRSCGLWPVRQRRRFTFFGRGLAWLARALVPRCW